MVPCGQGCHDEEPGPTYPQVKFISFLHSLLMYYISVYLKAEQGRHGYLKDRTVCQR